MATCLISSWPPFCPVFHNMLTCRPTCKLKIEQFENLKFYESFSNIKNFKSLAHFSPEIWAYWVIYRLLSKMRTPHMTSWKIFSNLRPLFRCTTSKTFKFPALVDPEILRIWEGVDTNTTTPKFTTYKYNPKFSTGYKKMYMLL